jgi:glycosyltransferase involved in cell wall biosynthesis
MDTFPIHKFVFWQGIMSIHQSSLLRNLANLPKVDVTLIINEDIPMGRKKSGWLLPDYGSTKIIMKPTQQDQQALLSGSKDDTVHVFSGTRGHPLVWNALRLALSCNATWCIQSESQNSLGFEGWLRLMRSRYDALYLRNRTKTIFSIGNMALDWFRQSGYPADRLVPFGYFVETPVLESINLLKSNMVELVFVGSPLRPKGLDILLLALRELKHLEWRLHIVGDGLDRAEFQSMCQQLEIEDRVIFHGIIFNHDVIRLLASSDLLILPSRWDGWGAVINEALMCGVPVICSNKCGAADLIKAERGHVFQSESVPGLQTVLHEEISQGRKGPARCAAIREWSKRIEGGAAARYFMDAVTVSLYGGTVHQAPWLQT